MKKIKIKRKVTKRKKKDILHQEIEVIREGKGSLFIVVRVRRKTLFKMLLLGMIVICLFIMLVLGLWMGGVGSIRAVSRSWIRIWRVMEWGGVWDRDMVVNLCKICEDAPKRQKNEYTQNQN